MRRSNAISIRVRMPSRGLVTRLPTESSDNFKAGDTRRTFSVAQQVRFEDGVVCAAPGYQQATVTGVAGESIDTDSSFTIFDLPVVMHLTAASDLAAAGFVVGSYFSLPDGTTFRVNSLIGVDLFFVFILAGSTYSIGSVVPSGLAMTIQGFPDGPVVHLHQGNLVNPAWLLDANTLADSATPLVAATPANLYSILRTYDSASFRYFAAATKIYAGTAADAGVPWFTADNNDRIIFAQRSNEPQTWLSGQPTTSALPGLPSDDALWDGVSVFFGHVLLWRGDRLKWSDVNDFTNYIPIGQTAASFILVVNTAGFVQPAVNATVVAPVTVDPATVGAVVGQFVRIINGEFVSYYTITATTTTTVTLRLEDLTGHTATGTTVAAGSQIFSLDANEAGETQITGSDSNGEILNIVRLGDYAFIFKRRSISSLQYVGVSSGVFFVHTEVTNEGLLAPQAVVNLGDGRLIFLGHREMYQYQGGPTPTPVCQQVTRQIFAEVDRSRLGEIILFHNENRKEVWLNYPVLGGSKVMIWNYVEDTATFDLVNSSLRKLTAFVAADWVADLRWIDIPDTTLWDTIDPSITWASLTGGSSDHLALMASGDGLLRVHGLRYTQDGLAYTALAETMDFDFGDSDAFKYVDLLVIAAQVKVPSTEVKNLYIQVGTKDSLDQPLRWSTPVAVNIQGGARPPLKINPGGSGRFIRVRFYSQDKDVQWRISTFEASCRKGNTF